MKNYLDFTLTGKKLFPVWLVLIVLVIVPYAYSVKMLTDAALTDVNSISSVFPKNFMVYMGVAIVAMLISFFIIKLTIEGVSYSGRGVRFEGRFGTYLGKVVLGTFLTIITLGIYSPWFIKNMACFFVNKSSLDDSKFEFLGNGSWLLLIFIFSYIFPIGLLQLVMMLDFFSSTAVCYTFIRQLIYGYVTMIVLIPYMYLFYQWLVDIRYKAYHITWKTKFGPACMMILGQMVLMVVTLGIYMPLGCLRLYRYFAERTVAEGDGKSLRFGYDLDAKGDFLFMLGQLLLTLVTAGIYYPWAFSKIGKRVLLKTYVMDAVEQDA